MTINPQQEITISYTNVQPGANPIVCIDARKMGVAFDIENFYNGKSHLRIKGSALYSEVDINGNAINISVAKTSPAGAAIDIRASIASRFENQTFEMYTQQADCTIEATVDGVTKTLGASDNPTQFNWSNS